MKFVVFSSALRANQALVSGLRKDSRRHWKKLTWLVKYGKIIMRHALYWENFCPLVLCKTATWNDSNVKFCAANSNDKSFILYVYSSVNPPHQNFAIHVWTIRQPRENLLPQQCRRWNRCKLLIIMQSFFRWLPSDFVCISNLSWAHAELAHFIVWYLQYRYRVIGQNLSSSDISPPSFKIFSPGMTALTFFYLTGN